MTRVRRETIAYLLIVGFCIVMLAWAIPAYTPPYPGYGASPALVPNVAVGVILAMALLALARVAMATFMDKPLPPEECEFPVQETGDSGFTQVGRVKLKHLALLMVPSALLVVAIDYIGFIPAAFLFLVIIQFVLGCRSWLQSILLSAITVTVLYVVMRYGFGVPIPGPQLI